MKKIKFGFLSLLALCVGSVTFVGCSGDEGDVKLTEQIGFHEKSNGSTEVYTQNIKLVDNTEVNGKMTFTLDAETGDLVGLKFSDELLDPSIGIDPIKIVEEIQIMGQRSECIKACKDEFIDPHTGDPISGFGACKFNCWVDSAVRTLSKIEKVLYGPIIS